jgi:hypothetical protein
MTNTRQLVCPRCEQTGWEEIPPGNDPVVRMYLCLTCEMLCIESGESRKFMASYFALMLNIFRRTSITHRTLITNGPNIGNIRLTFADVDVSQIELKYLLAFFAYRVHLEPTTGGPEP